MNHKTERYVIQAMAATGFVLVNPLVAFMLRPDLWRSLQDAATSFPNEGDLKEWLADHARILFTFAGGHSGYGGCFNMNRLEERALELYGLRLNFIRVTADEFLGRPAPAAMPVIRSNIEELRALAAQEPPSHDCTLRREILQAREQINHGRA